MTFFTRSVCLRPRHLSKSPIIRTRRPRSSSRYLAGLQGTFSQTGMPERLEILTLGGLRILVDGSPVRGLASRKAEALLVFLACQGGSPSRESLAHLLWDDRTSSGSLANLRSE